MICDKTPTNLLWAAASCMLSLSMMKRLLINFPIFNPHSWYLGYNEFQTFISCSMTSTAQCTCNTACNSIQNSQHQIGYVPIQLTEVMIICWLHEQFKNHISLKHTGIHINAGLIFLLPSLFKSRLKSLCINSNSTMENLMVCSLELYLPTSNCCAGYVAILVFGHLLSMIPSNTQFFSFAVRALFTLQRVENVWWSTL